MMLGNVKTPFGTYLTPSAKSMHELNETVLALVQEMGIQMDGAMVGRGANFVPAVKGE